MKIPEKFTLEAMKEFARDVYQQLADAASTESIAGQFQYYKKPPHQTREALKKAVEDKQVDELGRPKVNIRDYFRRLVVSVDTAAKDTERADYSVVQVWGETY